MLKVVLTCFIPYMRNSKLSCKEENVNKAIQSCLHQKLFLDELVYFFLSLLHSSVEKKMS